MDENIREQLQHIATFLGRIDERIKHMESVAEDAKPLYSRVSRLEEQVRPVEGQGKDIIALQDRASRIEEKLSANESRAIANRWLIGILVTVGIFLFGFIFTNMQWK